MAVPANTYNKLRNAIHELILAMRDAELVGREIEALGGAQYLAPFFMAHTDGEGNSTLDITAEDFIAALGSLEEVAKFMFENGHSTNFFKVSA
jgi:hypothetical protein